MLRRENLPAVRNVPAASTAGTALIESIPQGRVYHDIVLKFGGTFVASDLSEIRLQLGSKVIWRVSGAELSAINQYYSLTENASYLPLHFTDRQAQTAFGREAGAIDTLNFDYSDFSLEIDIDGTQTGSPTLEAFAHVGGVKDERVASQFRALLKKQHTPASDGEHQLPISIGTNLGNQIRCIHFKHSNITDIEVLKDAQSVMRKAPIADLQFYQNQVHRTTQSGYVQVDAIVDSAIADALDTLRRENGAVVGPAAMDWRVTTSASDTIQTIADIYATIATL